MPPKEKRSILTKKKHERLTYFLKAKDGSLVFPGESLRLVGPLGYCQSAIDEEFPVSEDRMMMAFAICLDPRTAGFIDINTAPLVEIIEALMPFAHDTGSQKLSDDVRQRFDAHGPYTGRLDPARVPVSWVRLFCMLSQAQYEIEHHPDHRHPRLVRKDICPRCELANHVLALAKTAASKARDGDWSNVAMLTFEIGCTMGLLKMARYEFSVITGAQTIRSAQDMGREKAKSLSTTAETRKRFIAKLLEREPDLPVGKVDQRTATKFGVGIPTAKRDRLSLKKK